MPIQPISFGRISFGEANPQLMRLQSNLANYIQAAKAANAPAMEQAQVAQAQNQGRYLGSEAGLNNEKTNWYARDIGSQIKERDATARKSLADAMITEKDLPWEDRLNQAKINFQNMGGSSGSTGSKEQAQLQASVGLDNPGLTPEEQREATNVLMGGGTSLSNGKKLNPMSLLTKGFYDRVIKAGTNSKGLSQMRGGALAADIMERGDKLIGDASEFSGLAGKGKLTADQLGASLGEDNPKYLAYQEFTRQIVPELANQMINLEGANASRESKKMMIRVANPLYWDDNPALAMKEWKFLNDTFKGYNRTISSGTSDIKQRLSQGLSNSKNSQSETPSNEQKADTHWEMVNGKLVQVK